MEYTLSINQSYKDKSLEYKAGNYNMLHKSKSIKIKAFTLVELSIVIVIIGLIIAGVVAGNSLVNSSKLQNVLMEKNKYQTAILTFKQQYNYLPGDIPNASSFWPGCNSGATNSDCNGNGNGKIDSWTGSVTDVENLRVWQHLAASGLIPGTYTGVATLGTTHTTLNAPSSAYNKGLWSFFSHDYNAWTVPVSSNILRLRNNLQIGVVDSTWQWEPFVPLFNPRNAYALDKKVDDGMPQAGNVWAINGGAGNMIGSGKTGQYKLDQPSVVHVLSFGYDG